MTAGGILIIGGVFIAAVYTALVFDILPSLSNVRMFSIPQVNCGPIYTDVGVDDGEKDKPKEEDVEEPKDLNDVDVDDLPDGWTEDDPDSAGRIRYRDPNGQERLRYDPPANGANGHWHHFGPNGTPLDTNGNPTYKGAPNSHIYP